MHLNVDRDTVIAEMDDEDEDVVALSIEKPFPDGMCALISSLFFYDLDCRYLDL